MLTNCERCGRTGERGFSGGRCTNITACDERMAKAARAAVAGRCIDCIAEGVTNPRPAPNPGPRCSTHHRAARNRARINTHARKVEVGYGITGEQYWALYEAQGGKCALCRVATGKTKRLAVDHDHACTEGHDPKRGCPKCVRGLCCGPCNEILGRWGVEALIRALNYRFDPPARKVLNP